MLTLAPAAVAKDAGSPIARLGIAASCWSTSSSWRKLSAGPGWNFTVPVPRESLLKTDAPWEGNACGYPSVFQDGKLYRMYYHAGHYRHGGENQPETRPVHPWFLCYAESDDGIHWRKPSWVCSSSMARRRTTSSSHPSAALPSSGDPAHTSVFKDANPDCPAEARYKCVIVGKPHWTVPAS
jgi:hypothetical protein